MVTRSQVSDFRLCWQNADEALTTLRNHLGRLELPRVYLETHKAALLQFQTGEFSELLDFVEEETEPAS